MENLLTVAIPTYNRSAFLDWTLRILKSYIDKGLYFNVLVSDNHSTDNTEDVVRKWQVLMPNLSYYCQSENKMAARNFLKCWQLFNTKYCWLLGDTRMITYREMKFLLSELSNNHCCDAFILNSNARLKIPSKLYSDINNLLEEQGWHITNMASCIITKDFVNHNNAMRYLNTNFVQVGIFIEHLCSLDKFSVKYMGNSDIFVNEYQIPGIVKLNGGGWRNQEIRVFARNWYMFVMSLPNQIKLEIKEQMAKDHNLYTEFFSFHNFRVDCINAKGLTFYNDFMQNKKYLRFTTNHSVWMYSFIVYSTLILKPLYLLLRKIKYHFINKTVSLPSCESFLK